MVPLIIEEGQSTPYIALDNTTGRFEITGNSLPEDVLGFYAPVIAWLEEYVETPAPKTEVHIKLSYFNSSSSKAILDVLVLLEGIAKRNLTIEIIWHYLDLDDDMLSTGKEFESMVAIPFQFVPYFL